MSEKQLNIPVHGKNIVLNCRMLECDMFFSVSENETSLISSLMRPEATVVSRLNSQQLFQFEFEMIQ